LSNSTHYDAIVIGAGQAGGPLSTAMAREGHKTAIIERKHVGGTCINVGCTPTKTMVASARMAYLARRSADYGVHTGPVTVDMQSVWQRKQAIVESWREGSQRRITDTEGVDLLMGEARFTGPKTVEVRLNQGGTLQLAADTVVINSGARPSIPPIEGLDGVPYLDSTSIMELGEVPEHLLVIGGGYVALEFGQMFRRFGSEVTLIQRSGQVLSREDADMAEEVVKILREDGIKVLLDTATLKVKQPPDGGVQVIVRAKGAPEGRTLSGSHLLVATGRVPNTDWLNPEAAGIKTDERGFIPVNERLETNVPGIYALGDVNGGPALTSISYDDFRIVCSNLTEDANLTTAGRLVPYTVFIDPELGRVGLTEKGARDQGYDVLVTKMPMSHVARALEMDETRGLMKVVLDRGTGQILGCAILGIWGGEMMAMLQLAMMGGLPYTALRDGVFAHPTLAESFNNLFSLVDDSAMSDITRRTRRTKGAE
jgi:pyruvate/2-oxoglutarate dehydrogenase complex dihydrolipoamide dehydrogenase (E3) component